MLRQIANKYINIKCTSGIASYTEKRTETSIKKNLQKIERIVYRDGVPKRRQTRVVRIVTKVKGRPYFFVIITRLLKNNLQKVPGK